MSELLGKKIGMTHIFTEDGKRHPVTVIETESLKKKDSDTDSFKAGDFVDVIGTSKGKGFQGGMKRWNWSGAPKTHGSMSHRRVGSIGASASPSRVLKGQHMPGHMGNKRMTVQNLKVVNLDEENNLLVIEGAVPGHRNSKLIIRKAKKKAHLRKEACPETKVESKPEKKTEVKADSKAEPKT
jgi:large subunit ribosomal protein L3